MTAPISVRINGDLFASIKDIEKKMQDFSVPLKAFGEHLRKVTLEDRFEKEQSPDGVKWKALNPKYAAYKKEEVGAQRQILEFSGILKRSIEAQMSGKKKLLFGSVIKYAARQNETRPFLGINEKDIDELKATISDYLIT